MLSIIQKDCDIFIFEAMHVHEVILDVSNIIVTSTELSLLANVVYANQQGPATAAAATGYNGEFLRDVHLSGRRQLRDLRIFLVAQELSHCC